jgi:hypothetical protein
MRERARSGSDVARRYRMRRMPMLIQNAHVIAARKPIPYHAERPSRSPARGPPAPVRSEPLVRLRMQRSCPKSAHTSVCSDRVWILAEQARRLRWPKFCNLDASPLFRAEVPATGPWTHPFGWVCRGQAAVRTRGLAKRGLGGSHRVARGVGCEGAAPQRHRQWSVLGLVRVERQV